MSEVKDLRRVRIVRVSIRFILNFLYNQSRLPDVVYVPTINLPDGFEVVRRAEDVGGLCYCYEVYHPSFERVPEGEPIPELEGHESMWGWVALDVRNQDSAREVMDKAPGVGGLRIPPVTKITCDRDRLKVVLYLPIDSVVDRPSLDRVVDEWLAGERDLVLFGVDRIELYEFPEVTTGADNSVIHVESMIGPEVPVIPKWE